MYAHNMEGLFRVHLAILCYILTSKCHKLIDISPPLGCDEPEIDLCWETASRPPAIKSFVQAGISELD